MYISNFSPLAKDYQEVSSDAARVATESTEETDMVALLGSGSWTECASFGRYPWFSAAATPGIRPPGQVDS